MTRHISPPAISAHASSASVEALSEARIKLILAEKRLAKVVAIATTKRIKPQPKG
jgi:hypothetical protein